MAFSSPKTASKQTTFKKSVKQRVTNYQNIRVGRLLSEPGGRYPPNPPLSTIPAAVLIFHSRLLSKTIINKHTI